MHNKSWSIIEDWKEIFGKDRADGAKIIDVGDAAAKPYGNKAEQGEDGVSSQHMTLDELFPDEVFPESFLPEMVDENRSVTQGATPTPKPLKKILKKRKMDDKLDGIITLMTRIHEDTNERLKEISTRIVYDFDLSTKRAEIFDQMQGIPGLTLKQQFYISKKLVKEPEIMDLFRGLSEIACPAFVFDLLEIDGKL